MEIPNRPPAVPPAGSATPAGASTPAPPPRPAAPPSPAAVPGDAATPRAARLAAIRAQIAAGAYDTEERMDAALDRLLADL